MSKYLITLTKQEIEQAILDYVNRDVTIDGRIKLQNPLVDFSNKDGSIGYFEATIEVKSDANPPESNQAKTEGAE